MLLAEPTRFLLWHIRAGWLLLWVLYNSGLSGMRIFRHCLEQRLHQLQNWTTSFWILHLSLFLIAYIPPYHLLSCAPKSIFSPSLHVTSPLIYLALSGSSTCWSSRSRITLIMVTLFLQHTQYESVTVALFKIAPQYYSWVSHLVLPLTVWISSHSYS